HFAPSPDFLHPGHVGFGSGMRRVDDAPQLLVVAHKGVRFVDQHRRAVRCNQTVQSCCADIHGAHRPVYQGVKQVENGALAAAGCGADNAEFWTYLETVEGIGVQHPQGQGLRAAVWEASMAPEDGLDFIKHRGTVHRLFPGCGILQSQLLALIRVLRLVLGRRRLDGLGQGQQGTGWDVLTGRLGHGLGQPFPVFLLGQYRLIREQELRRLAVHAPKLHRRPDGSPGRDAAGGLQGKRRAGQGHRPPAAVGKYLKRRHGPTVTTLAARTGRRTVVVARALAIWGGIHRSGCRRMSRTQACESKAARISASEWPAATAATMTAYRASLLEAYRPGSPSGPCRSTACSRGDRFRYPGGGRIGSGPAAAGVGLTRSNSTAQAGAGAMGNGSTTMYRSPLR